MNQNNLNAIIDTMEESSANADLRIVIVEDGLNGYLRVLKANS